MNMKCQKTDCERYYTNVPYGEIASWFNTEPENGKCSYYIKQIKESKRKTK